MGVISPTRRLEFRLSREHGYRVILGVDEVGVAPSSGPVVACALARKILWRATTVGLGAASVREIDQLNIYYATVLAMKRAVTRAGDHDYVIVDGRHIRGFEEHAGPYRAVIDGDALCYVISCASIVAKVTRDRLMTRLAARYPGYGWEHNAGYATADHRAGMALLGVTPHHRRSFITTKRILEGEQTSFDLFAVESLADALVEASIPA
jgi:ribonuclease HII